MTAAQSDSQSVVGRLVIQNAVLYRFVVVFVKAVSKQLVVGQ